MAYVDARRDALSALAFSSNQVTIMVLVIIGCVIFAICLLLAVLVVRRRDAHVKALHAATSVRANGGAGNGAVLASPRKSSLTIANLNANSMQLTQVSNLRARMFTLIHIRIRVVRVWHLILRYVRFRDSII